MPLDVSRINSFQPCESCGYRRSQYRAEFNPPGTTGVTHRLCGTCIEGVRQ
jgi:hypothetical protein